MSINLLFAAHPTSSPAAAAIGNAPIGYLNELPDQAIHIASLAPFRILLHTSLTRAQVRQICRAAGPTELAKYACIMAWGGQNRGHFRMSIGASGLVPLIRGLFASVDNRANDFDLTKNAAVAIPGLGISFFTKLPFFLRRNPDAYILDQWTAKSTVLLSFPPLIRLSALLRHRTGNVFAQARPDTTPKEYESFCVSLENFGHLLWHLAAPASGEAAEIAMFDRSRPDGFWRHFTKDNFNHPVAGALLASGGQSLTTPLDYRVGFLVIQQINPRRLFVISIHVACCHWSGDDCYRLLLARLRELNGQHGLPVTLVIQGGPSPAWFSTALAELGIEVAISDGADLPSPANDEEESDADGDTGAALSKPGAQTCALPSSNDAGAGSASTQGLPVPLGDRNNKTKIWLCDQNRHNGDLHRSAIRILTKNDHTIENDGAICLRHGFLDLKLKDKSPHFLIADIGNYNIGGALHAVSFTTDPQHNPAIHEQTHCWGGVGYEGHLKFGARHGQAWKQAVAYLKVFFNVLACTGNRGLTQALIDTP